ncbi:MAG: ATP-binding protein [Gemmatimonadetes bacterium]|nr:ATP-binding protein [Gemmatimonadota bacterium]
MSAPPTKTRKKPLSFRVRPRILTLLGDQLIRDATLAVFELVKNAYDADATFCAVELIRATDEVNAQIIISDDGSGMSEAILRNVWMVIGTDFRAVQRASAKRTTRFRRLPLGEKGLGRLSVHKLGRTIEIVTRAKNGAELVMAFDWDKLERAADLDSATITLRQRTPKTFPGKSHGTRVVVSNLRETWSRGEVRRLYRSVNALRSPYKGPSDFAASLTVPGHEEWISNLFSAESARDAAVYVIQGSFEGKTGRFVYRFRPPIAYGRQLNGREQRVNGIPLLKKRERSVEPIDLSIHNIGKVNFELLIYDRDPKVLQEMADDVSGLKKYLDENGGIRIYRDGIRVYDFGEPGNDWLNLDMRRVNTPTARISNNQVLGVLQLDALASTDLREKTNREGFIESSASVDFREAVMSVLTAIEAEKSKDQRRLREALGKGTGQKVFSKLAELRETLSAMGQLSQVEPLLKSVEVEMELYRDQLLHAAVPGLTIGIMLHGAEKILDELRAATRRDVEPVRVRELIDRLYRSMRPVTNLLKNPGTTDTSASTLIKEAIFSAELRLKRHGVRLLNQPEQKRTDFRVRGSKQMLIASLNNLIDNSLHWLESKAPPEKLLFVGITHDLEGGPAIVVADNGPGFGVDDPEDLTSAFFSRRNGGMGLGLYIVSEVMRVNHGRLVFPRASDIDMPRALDGAVVALQFPKTND